MKYALIYLARAMLWLVRQLGDMLGLVVAAAIVAAVAPYILLATMTEPMEPGRYDVRCSCSCGCAILTRKGVTCRACRIGGHVGFARQVHCLIFTAMLIAIGCAIYSYM